MGSGPGNHAVVLQKNGFEVLCLDNSSEMLKKCKEKGLVTIHSDLENLNLPEKSFDAIWAYTSLLHVPKNNLSSIITTICKILKDNGYFFLSLKEGNGEGFIPFEKGGQRWFSYYTDEEIRTLLQKDFEIIRYWKVPINGKNKAFLDYFCRKKSSPAIGVSQASAHTPVHPLGVS